MICKARKPIIRIITCFVAAAITLPLVPLQVHGVELVASQQGLLSVIGLGGGALVCPSVADAQMAFRLMSEARNERTQDQLFGKLATEMRGPSIQFDPASLGCVIAPPGTALTRDERMPWVHVTGVLPDGTRFAGQALPGTFEHPPRQCPCSPELLRSYGNPAAQCTCTGPVMPWEITSIYGFACVCTFATCVVCSCDRLTTDKRLDGVPAGACGPKSMGRLVRRDQRRLSERRIVLDGATQHTTSRLLHDAGW